MWHHSMVSWHHVASHDVSKWTFWGERTSKCLTWEVHEWSGVFIYRYSQVEVDNYILKVICNTQANLNNHASWWVDAYLLNKYSDNSRECEGPSMTPFSHMLSREIHRSTSISSSVVQTGGRVLGTYPPLVESVRFSRGSCVKSVTVGPSHTRERKSYMCGITLYLCEIQDCVQFFINAQCCNKSCNKTLFYFTLVKGHDFIFSEETERKC